MRYLIYAAGREGFPNVARLFTAIADAERIHASNHYGNILGKGAATSLSGEVSVVRNSSDELQAGIDGEPSLQSDRRLSAAAATSFRWPLEAERIQIGLYQNAK